LVWWSKQQGRWKRAAWVKKKTYQIEVLQARATPNTMEEIKHFQAEIDDKLERAYLNGSKGPRCIGFVTVTGTLSFSTCMPTNERRPTRLVKLPIQRVLYAIDPTPLAQLSWSTTSLFSHHQGPSGMDACLAILEERVTREMNEQLSHAFSKEEVSVAISQMSPYKSLGLDGFPPCFYQKYWPIIDEEVCQVVLFCLNSNRSLAIINDTNIVPIPKKQQSTQVTNFRPISLCNVIYKLVLKVLTNRLKQALPHIISPNQSAFVVGRHITDNILAAYKTLHTMNSNLTGK
jgi:hypothetical protein